MTAVCVICDTEISRDNDAPSLELILTKDRKFMLKPPRHLMPVVENGNTVCIGTPSLAQYLEGQPRDPDPEDVYYPELEDKIRAIYAWMR